MVVDRQTSLLERLVARYRAVRDVGLSRVQRNLALGAAYAGFVTFGTVLLGHAGDELLAQVLGSLVLLIAVAGFAVVAHDWWFLTHRPSAELLTAPSGASATAFRRSSGRIVLALVFCPVAALWCLTITVLCWRAGRTGFAVAFAVLGLLLLGPLLDPLRGRVAAGGLYLTPDGIEHRNEGVEWSLPWHRVELARPGDPLLLLLNAPPDRREWTRVAWRRDPPSPQGMQLVDCRYLAGDPVLIGVVILRCLHEPELRARLGTAESVAEVVAMRAPPAP